MLTQNELKETLHYNEHTGIFTWITRRDGVTLGMIGGWIVKAGCKKYIHIEINGKTYKAHRLAFLYMEGEFPPEQVDHKNGNGLDNKWINLRHATITENARNRKLQKNNTTGQVGVRYYKPSGKWLVTIGLKGKEIHLGYHINFETACTIRLGAELWYGYHKNHGSVRAL